MTVVDAQEKRLSYEASGEKMPFFVKRMANNWHIEPMGVDRCRIHMRLECGISPAIFRVFPGPMMKMKLNTMLSNALEEFKYFTENGKPHPRKIKASQKWQKAQMKAA